MWKASAGKEPIYPSYGQRSLVGYSPWCHKRVRHDLAIKATIKCVKHGFCSGGCGIVVLASSLCSWTRDCASLLMGGTDRGENWVVLWWAGPYSIQFSCSVMSDFLPAHTLQHARLPCTSPTPRTSSNSCPLSQWYHSTISSSIISFSSCLQHFPALGSFLKSQFFASGGQSIGASALASILPMNIQDWFLFRVD